MTKKRYPWAEKFPGFDRYYYQNFFVYPILLSEYWYELSGSEQKVLDFILRQTIGWRQECDSISLDQFQNGVGGKSKGRGTGLSISQIRRAIKGLEKKGFITVHRRKTWVSTFCLVIKPDQVPDYTKKAHPLDAFRKLN